MNTIILILFVLLLLYYRCSVFSGNPNNKISVKEDQVETISFKQQISWNPKTRKIRLSDRISNETFRKILK